jgi:hypothetical protein
VIKIKTRGFFARNQGPEHKKQDYGLYFWETEGLFNKITKRRGIGHPRPLDLESTVEIRSERENAQGRKRALTSGPGRLATRGRGRLTGPAQLQGRG